MAQSFDAMTQQFNELKQITSNYEQTMQAVTTKIVSVESEMNNKIEQLGMKINTIEQNVTDNSSLELSTQITQLKAEINTLKVEINNNKLLPTNQQSDINYI